MINETIKEYNLKEIGERIKNERKRKDFNYTLDELAAKLNITRQTLSKWEKGEASPSLHDFLLLCNLFECELGYLLGEYTCRTGRNTDIAAETGLSEIAIVNLQIADTARYDTDNRIYNEKRLRDYQIGKFAKTPFISFLLESDELWERIAVSAYDYGKQMEKYRSAPTHSVEGITHDQFANAAKERAKEALSALLDKMIEEIDISEWEEA